MNDTSPAQRTPPLRLLVQSDAEAAKIREYSTAFVTFEQAVARFEKTKRWREVQRRTDAMLHAFAGRPLNACMGAWMDWQAARALHACAEMGDKDVAKFGESMPGAYFFIAAHKALTAGRETARTRWLQAIVKAIAAGSDDGEAVLLDGGTEAAEYCRARLADARERAANRHNPHQTALNIVARLGQFDAGQRAGLIFGTHDDEFVRTVADPARWRSLIEPARIAAWRDRFLRAFAETRRVRELFHEQWGRRQRLLEDLAPVIVAPPGEWHEARFFAWLYGECASELRARVCRSEQTRTDDDFAALLGAPMTWHLWLQDQWEAAGAELAALEPQRTVLRELVESPRRFLRFPNPTPMIADLRRALRPVSDLLEGAPLEGRAAVLGALQIPGATHSLLLQVLASYCALRWSTGVPPKIRARLAERLTAFLRDEVVPQGPEILRDCAIDVAPVVRTNFEAEFEKLLAAEEAAQQALAAEMQAHAEAWRDRLPPREAAAVAELPPASEHDDEPLVVRYLFNLGEAHPREERLTTTRAGLEEAIAALCRHEGIAVNIPFSSIAHAIEHYLFRTPAEKKHVWPERETYGPLELHKIKRGGMRLLVRESDEGLWLHLLQRKNWFLGER